MVDGRCDSTDHGVIGADGFEDIDAADDVDIENEAFGVNVLTAQLHTVKNTNAITNYLSKWQIISLLRK